MFKCLILLFVINTAVALKKNHEEKLSTVFSWKQLRYTIEGVLYNASADYRLEMIEPVFTPKEMTFFVQENNVPIKHFMDNASADYRPDMIDPVFITEEMAFFVQENNVPIGFEVYKDRVFVTVPRRRYGIPSTLNFVPLDQAGGSPALQPYPSEDWRQELVSVYRPRVDECGSLWFVDTGLLEVPGAWKQMKPPTIYVFDLNTDELVLKHELKKSVLRTERTPAGLTSITVDVTAHSCADAHAYITDLSTSGLIVFSMRHNDSWRIEHGTFQHDPAALNFTVAGHTIDWKDGLFSIALTEPDSFGRRTAFYHPLVSTQEFAVGTEVLKSRVETLDGYNRLVGNRGPSTQSGSHAYHAATRTLFFASVAQDAVLCWRVSQHTMTPGSVGVAVQDHEKLVYVSDLKISGDEVWVLVNQIPKFIYSGLNPGETNFYIHRANVRDLIHGTVCDRHIHSL